MHASHDDQDFGGEILGIVVERSSLLNTVSDFGIKIGDEVVGRGVGGVGFTYCFTIVEREWNIELLWPRSISSYISTTFTTKKYQRRRILSILITSLSAPLRFFLIQNNRKRKLNSFG